MSDDLKKSGAAVSSGIAANGQASRSSVSTASRSSGDPSVDGRGGGGGQRGPQDAGGNGAVSKRRRAKRKPAGTANAVSAGGGKAADATDGSDDDAGQANDGDEAAGGSDQCYVCFKSIGIYSIGECDHPICYECSTRMRVLCKQNECPICRTDMSKVIFSEESQTYRQLEINNRSGLYDKKHRISFTSTRCQDAHRKLLDHPCTICAQNFNTFESLREHVRKKHERHFCDICTATLFVFSSERRSYTRHDLGIHRRIGDPDDTSHRGHPLCQYCDLRFFDRDELFKHLRKEHFYCYICDQDGRNVFFQYAEELRHHYRTEHYLCEDAECAQDKFIAFRTEIDLRAHIVGQHAAGLSRQAARQNRTISGFEINLPPRNGAHNADGAGASAAASALYRDTQNEFDLPNDDAQQQQRAAEQQRSAFDARNENDFPTLGGQRGGQPATSAFTLPTLHRSYGGARGIARTLDNFPALGGGSADSAAAVKAPAQSGKKTASALLKGGGSVGGTTASAKAPARTANGPAAANDFPSLSGKAKKPAALFSDDDFIPLSGASSQYAANASAKHRSLVTGGYESALTAAAQTKLAVVKQPTAVAAAKKPADSAPKITSKAMFPSLGNAPGSALASEWTSLGSISSTANGKKQTKVVAPKASLTAKAAPAARPTPSATSPKKPTAAKPSPAASSVSASSKASAKPKPKNYNPFECDSDEEDFAPASSSILSVVSAKHRGLVDNYESVARAGATKLALVQQRDADKPSQPAKTAPKLNSADNFPSLGSGSSSAGRSAAPGKSFMDIMKASSGSPDTNNNRNGGAKVRPPPGFGASAGPPPGFEKPKKQPANPGLVASHAYRSPPNMDDRNATLFQALIVQNAVAANSFFEYSTLFMGNEYGADAYYENCRSTLGSKFNERFPELLALLPNIGKQQELLHVHLEQQMKSGAKPKKRQGATNAIELCATCGQALVASDLNVHVQSHALENLFPTLNKPTSSPSVWKK